MRARVHKSRKQSASKGITEYIADESRPALIRLVFQMSFSALWKAYSSPPRPARRRESSHETSDTPSASATQPADSTGRT